MEEVLFQDIKNNLEQQLNEFEVIRSMFSGVDEFIIETSDSAFAKLTAFITNNNKDIDILSLPHIIFKVYIPVILSNNGINIFSFIHFFFKLILFYRTIKSCNLC